MDRHSLVQLPPALLAPPTIRGARFVLGVDGGATKTLAGVLDLDSQALHFARGGPSNEDVVGAEAAVHSLLGLTDEALQRAGIGWTELARAVLAVAGTDTHAIARHVRAARSDEWIVVNDVVAAWAAATGATPGVGVISGTGSNVFGVGPGGRSWRVGGWGHLLGDEGSGYWLGARSIAAALHERDGSGPPTALSEAAMQFFGAPTVEAVAALVYAKPLTKRDVAAFATETARIAESGDAVAKELCERGARELARQVCVVIEKTGLGSDRDTREPFDVGLIGSVFNAGAMFVGPLTATVSERAPAARVRVVDMPPVGGSLLLAARACGRTLAGGELAPLLDAALAASR